MLEALHSVASAFDAIEPTTQQALALFAVSGASAFFAAGLSLGWLWAWARR